jgi:hypothetical protein
MVQVTAVPRVPYRTRGGEGGGNPQLQNCDQKGRASDRGWLLTTGAMALGGLSSLSPCCGLQRITAWTDHGRQMISLLSCMIRFAFTKAV